MIGHIAIAALALVPVPIDPLCAELKTFAKAKFEGSEDPVGRRWVEFHWRGAWLAESGWAKQCTAANDAASRRLCDYMVDHSSFEFASRLPVRILECNGYRFPDRNAGAGWKTDTEILDRDLRWLKLEVDFTFEEETGAIRFSSFAKDRDSALAEMQPLKPMPPFEAEEVQ